MEEMAVTVAVTEEMVATAAVMVATAAVMEATAEMAAKVGLPRIVRRIRWLSR